MGHASGGGGNVMQLADELADELGLQLESPLVITIMALGALAIVVLAAIVVWQFLNAMRAAKKKKKRDRIVRIAEVAPEDDADEHELEQRDGERAAAPGDSDGDESLTPKKPSSKWKNGQV